MRIQTYVASLLVALGAVSCGENASPSSQSGSANASGALKNAPPALHPREAQAASPGGEAAVPQQAAAPPQDARWTILCDTVEGPGHVAQATLAKSKLAQASRMPDWYVIHTEKDSSIYYGYYRGWEIPSEKKRADADRARLAALTDTRGNPVLRGSVLVPVIPPDPVAPADWNLLNTPGDAYWTIEVATFSGDVNRKEAAVQTVRELREKGEKQAYYFHGPTVSSVCIGAWKREAVAEQGTGITKSGVMRDDAHTQRADQPLLVLPDVLPPNMPARVFEPGTGKPMTVMAQKLEILDPDMKQKAKEYPDHFVNYQQRGITSKGQTFPDPSVLVMIPHDQSIGHENDWRLTGGGGGGGVNGVAGAQQPPVQTNTPRSAGDSVLRSLGDH